VSRSTGANITAARRRRRVPRIDAASLLTIVGCVLVAVHLWRGVRTPRGGARDASAALSAPLDLRVASADELQVLPEIGPALARRIVAYRHAVGGITRADDLMRVPGVGQGVVRAVEPYVRTAHAWPR
jgi:DNA uptake protein ComE-like DNA-binding protein